MKFLKVVFLGTAVALHGCGGDGGGSSSSNDDSPEPSASLTGTLLDSPVINIGYRTESLEGVTNALGQYQYKTGETVTFFIGAIELPSVTATGTLTPLDLVGTKDTENSTVVNIIRLLQTLDQDGDPANGITITNLAKTTATAVNFSLSESDFESSSAVINLITNGGQSAPVSSLVDKTAAVSHFENELAANDISFGSIFGVWNITERPEVHIGGSDISTVVFLPNGKYYMAESNEINEGDGFEYGTYTFSGGVLSITTLVDTNSEIGFSTIGAAAAHLAINLQGDTFSFPTNDSRESGNYTFTKQALAQSSIGGAWLSDDGLALFVFLQNGEYLGLQHEESNGFVGFEWGAYEFSGGSLSTSTFDNSDGEALLCNLPSTTQCQGNSVAADVVNGSLIISVPQEGDFHFVNLFPELIGASDLLQ